MQIAGLWHYTTLETLAYAALSDRLIMAALDEVHVCPLVIQASGGEGAWNDGALVIEVIHSPLCMCVRWSGALGWNDWHSSGHVGARTLMWVLFCCHLKFCGGELPLLPLKPCSYHKSWAVSHIQTDSHNAASMSLSRGTVIGAKPEFAHSQGAFLCPDWVSLSRIHQETPVG